MSDIDLKEYQVIPADKATAVKVLVDMWERLGKPDSPLTTNGEKLMNVAIATWEDLFPHESSEWIKMRADYQDNELSISEQVSKGTGRSLASYPMYIYRIMEALFPKFKSADRENAMLMARKWPIFRMANKI